MNREILKPNAFFVDKDPEEYRQLSIALSYAGNRLNQLIMKKQVADYRQQNLVMKQELQKRKVLKDLSDFESFIPKAIRDELVNNDIWNTAGETAQIVQGVAPAVQAPAVAPVARQPAPPLPQEEAEVEAEEEEEEEAEEEAEAEEAEPLLPQVVSVNKMTEDIEKVEAIIRNVEDTIGGKTTKELERRYDDIQLLGNERGLTNNAKVFLENIEAIHVRELDIRGVLEELEKKVEETRAQVEKMGTSISKGVEEQVEPKSIPTKPKRGRKAGSTDTKPRTRRTKAQMTEARRKAKELSVEATEKVRVSEGAIPPKKKPLKVIRRLGEVAGEGMKRRGRPKGSKNKAKANRMNLLVGSAIAGNDNGDLLKVISKR